eukprot:TRINITY_DN50452_c0_g1_i1.p1 TRINITY_DN50452_c0_g1~~TRINITY_DN50452_c0_g1_i1.p1  ORF type:complete len:1601 (+),score=147.34 TRINITY_DN50452_c0_g1_i1:689-4804(+)
MASNCTPTLELTGCLPTVPCAMPILSNATACRVNVSQCDNVRPGATCTVDCRAPFITVFGGSTEAVCPLTNVDFTSEPLWSDPSCEITCADPLPPIGYRKNSSDVNDWVCDDGYIGDASLECVVELSLDSVIIIGFPTNVNGVDRSMLNGAYVKTVNKAYWIGGRETYWHVDGLFYYLYYCLAQHTWSIGMSAGWRTNLAGTTCDSVAYTAPYSDLLNPTGVSFDSVFGSAGWSSVDTARVLGFGAEQCVPSAILSGCREIVPCNVPIDTSADLCQLDFSECGNGVTVPVGDSCEVKCKQPYVAPNRAEPVFATCPELNTDPNGLEYTQPECDIGCGAVSIQEGYYLRDWPPPTRWACADGWIGTTVWKRCVADKDCIVWPTLVGCDPLVPCAPLYQRFTPVEKCLYTTVGCDSLASLPAGNNFCEVRCKAPYNGSNSYAMCTPGNVDPEKELFWARTPCQCPVPPVIPRGYELYSPHQAVPPSWRCAAGYEGTLSARCIVDPSDCDRPTLILSGCELVVPCTVKNFTDSESCAFNMSRCPMPLASGSSCGIRCMAPYKSGSTTARCPVANSDPLSPIEIESPCVLECSHNSIPKGYAKGRWRCAEDYRGKGVETCGYRANSTDADEQESENCSTETEVSGCFPLVPCAQPEVVGLESCLYDFSDCGAVHPGQVCEIRCKAGASGRSTPGLCPPDNIIPNRALVWARVPCIPVCSDPSPPPSGYVKTHDCGWQCTQEYTGVPEVSCDFSSDIFFNNGRCETVFALTGCVKREVCRAISSDDYDTCKYNISGCDTGIVPPGYSCSARCREPWTSDADGQVVCPYHNTELNRIMHMEEPVPACFFPCPEPVVTPSGYIKINGIWQCDSSYGGKALVVCSADRDADCNNRLVFSGCLPLRNCQRPSVSDECRIDISQCDSVAPGYSCEVRCRSPVWRGEATVASCLEGNTDLGRELDMVLPDCALECQPPVFHCRTHGGRRRRNCAYDRNVSGHWSDWNCADNAVGVAVVGCDLSPNCDARIVLEGCVLLQPCVIPEVDKCRLDVTDCDPLQAGSTCQADCAPQFLGTNFTGTCPHNNTDNAFEVQWSPKPECVCPDPSPIPEGYVRLEEFAPGHGVVGWQCAAEYTGQAIAECLCTGQIKLTGCTRIVACAPPADEYMADRSQCRSISAGSTCTAQCLNVGCISGGPLKFHCDAQNTNPDQPPVLEEGRCLVQCVVCKTTGLTDTDSGEGVLSGTLSFGAAHAAGTLWLPEVLGYRIVFTGSCDEDIGEAHAFVPSVDYDPGCCRLDTYSVRFASVRIPAGTEAVTIKVRTKYGDLPYGKKITFKDYTGSPTQKPRQISAAGGRRTGMFGLLLSWWLMLASFQTIFCVGLALE